MLSTPQNLPPEDSFEARLHQVRTRVALAATAAGRDVRQITLLAVTKGQPAAAIHAAMAAGLTSFGENYLDEALPKIALLSGTPAEWHFIGRLQANKTRPVAASFAWVHSIDRLRIAERLSAQRSPQLPPLNVCVQVHIADDPAKGGVAPNEAIPLLQQISALPHLRVRGFMCMLPYETPVAGQHQWFGQMRALLATGQEAGLEIDTLSMGMSADLDAAIEEGATIVRIGTALFGARAA